MHPTIFKLKNTLFLDIVYEENTNAIYANFDVICIYKKK